MRPGARNGESMSIELEAFLVGGPRKGWCLPCALPSLVEVDFVVADLETLRPGPRRTVRFCTDCGKLWEEDRELRD